MYGFVFNFLKNEQVHFHKQTVINRNLSVGIHDGMGCVICSPLPAIQRIQYKFLQVVSVSSFFKFLTASNPHPLTIEGRASGKVSNAPSMPFSKNDKISDGGRGAANLQPICLPIFHRYKWQRQRAFGQFCPQLPRNLGGSRPIHFWIGCSQRETPSAGDVGGRPKFGASVVAPVQISRKVQKSPTKKGGEHHT